VTNSSEHAELEGSDETMPSDLGATAVRDVCAVLNGLLADAFGLYLKTKNFHWHVSGPHFRDYHGLFDDLAEQVFAMTDPLAERVRKAGGTTLRSLNQAAEMTRVQPNEAEHVSAPKMIAELVRDNRGFLQNLRDAHAIADHHDDVATASLVEIWIDEAEARIWFLHQTSRDPECNRK
jgi:starvation-inducible DNA-binding protein